MNFSDRLRFLFGSKESQARIVTTMSQLGRAVSTPANYEGFAVQGYQKNLIVYSAISKITTAAKGVNWLLYSKQKTANGKLREYDTHPLLTLLDKPNPLQARAAFFESIVGYKMIAGNSYIESNKGVDPNRLNGPPLELWPVRPDKMKIVGGKNGYPSAYRFSYGGQDREWAVDPIQLRSNITHWKSFHPTNDWYGLSPLEAAMLALDQNNAGQRWNLALLQNAATPSGVLQMKTTESNPRGELTDAQYARIKKEFQENYQGSRNAGKPLLLEGGLAWQAVSISPKDMDYIKSREVTAIDLCIALGVPPEIMGLGQKTFNNYAEARLSFYEETILPTLDDLRDTLNGTIVKDFGEDLHLDYDRDAIEALRTRTVSLYTALQPVTFLTVNEKRAQVGYEEIEGGDELPSQSPSIFGAQPSNQEPDAEDESSGDEVEQEDDVEDTEETDKEFHWKSINLLNPNEKKNSWRKQNQWRRRLEKGFARDLNEDFSDLAVKLGNTAQALEGKDAKVIEFALLKTLDDWADGPLEKTLKTHIRMVITDFGDMVLGEGKSLGFDKENKANRKFDDFVREYISKHTATAIKTIRSTNEKTVRRVVSQYVEDAITDGDDLINLQRRLEGRFKDLGPSSANRIARTEVGMASTQGSLEAVKSLSIPNMFKEWVSASDERVRDGAHGGADHAIINGQEVPLDEKFSVPPDSDMDGPGDPSAPADQVINCRCVVTFRSKN